MLPECNYLDTGNNPSLLPITTGNILLTTVSPACVCVKQVVKESKETQVRAWFQFRLISPPTRVDSLYTLYNSFNLIIIPNRDEANEYLLCPTSIIITLPPPPF
jgi:hypothetical protein